MRKRQPTWAAAGRSRETIHLTQSTSALRAMLDVPTGWHGSKGKTRIRQANGMRKTRPRLAIRAADNSKKGPNLCLDRSRPLYGSEVGSPSRFAAVLRTAAKLGSYQ